MTSKALTAEGRISAIVLALLPPILGVAMYIINPDYMTHAVQHHSGSTSHPRRHRARMLVGFFWMKKIIKIEV